MEQSIYINTMIRSWSGYNYVMNNPVLLSNPNGDDSLTGAVLGFLTNGIQNLINKDSFFKGGLQAATMGFIGGAWE